MPVQQKPKLRERAPSVRCRTERDCSFCHSSPAPKESINDTPSPGRADVSKVGRRAPGLVSWPTGNLFRSLLEWDKGMVMTLPVSAVTSWRDLDELRQLAFRQGFAQDQFDHAIEKVGADPHHVANELQRQLFVAALYDGP